MLGGRDDTISDEDGFPIYSGFLMRVFTVSKIFVFSQSNLNRIRKRMIINRRCGQIGFKITSDDGIVFSGSFERFQSQ